mmetsp:Transcript_25584/g.60486  ORF Transcript_25584/g.60486 Transcript_25584/m.60486 type:complete len:80 (-) Transcript_25584:182-421(-)
MLLLRRAKKKKKREKRINAGREDDAFTRWTVSWSKYPFGWLPDKADFVNLPPAFAKYDTIPMKDFHQHIRWTWNETKNN